MKRCKICGSLLNPRHDNQLYCSKKCARLGVGIFFTSGIMKGTTIKDFFNHMYQKKSVVD
jgi:hypothetical protein